jgi:Putative peptidoglycan binding domain
MTGHRAATGNFIISACVAVALTGCAATPFGPTVQVMPGPGKSFDAFQNDNASCKGFAASQVQGQADAANQQAVGTGVLGTVIGAGLGAAVGAGFGNAGAGAAVGAASGAGLGTAYGANGNSYAQMSIQQQYDNAFSQCMYAKGDQVPGYAPIATAPPPPPPGAVSVADPLVRSTQSELIRLGYLQGGADGYMGPRTRNAISSFEQSSGLPADGYPSPTLLARLQSTPTGSPPGAPAPTASAPSNWVAPTGSASAAPPGAPSAPPTGWVAPAKTP